MYFLPLWLLSFPYISFELVLGISDCIFSPLLHLLYVRGPQPMGHRLVLVHGLLGTRPQSRRWAAGKRVKLHLYLQPLPIAHITTWALPPVRSEEALDSLGMILIRAWTLLWTAHARDLGHVLLNENLMPDDLRESWGGDLRWWSEGERLLSWGAAANTDYH